MEETENEDELLIAALEKAEAQEVINKSSRKMEGNFDLVDNDDFKLKPVDRISIDNTLYFLAKYSMYRDEQKPDEVLIRSVKEANEHFNSTSRTFLEKTEENKESTWDVHMSFGTFVEKCFNRWEIECVTTETPFIHCACGTPCNLFFLLKTKQNENLIHGNYKIYLDYDCLRAFQGVFLPSVGENLYMIYRNLSKNFCGVNLLEYCVKTSVITEKEKKMAITERNLQRSLKENSSYNFKTLCDMYSLKWKIMKHFCRGHVLSSCHNDVLLMISQLYTDVSSKICVRNPTQEEKDYAYALMYAARNPSDNYNDTYVGITKKLAIEGASDLSTKEETALGIFKGQKLNKVVSVGEEYSNTIAWIWKQKNDIWFPVLDEIRTVRNTMIEQHKAEKSLFEFKAMTFTPPYVIIKNDSNNNNNFIPIKPEEKSCPFPPDQPYTPRRTSVSGTETLTPRMVIPPAMLQGIQSGRISPTTITTKVFNPTSKQISMKVEVKKPPVAIVEKVEVKTEKVEVKTEKRSQDSLFLVDDDEEDSEAIKRQKIEEEAKILNKVSKYL